MANPASSETRRSTIAIISLEEMGFRIARLLMHHSYPVITNLDGRSEATKRRSRQAGLKVLSIPDLILQSDVILSIVPPKDALATAGIIAANTWKHFAGSPNNKIAYMAAGSSPC